MEQRLTEKIDEYDRRIQQIMQSTVEHRVNQLGEEIAQDVNSLEKKIKQVQTYHSSFEGQIKEAMLTLERKFDKAMEHKPIVRTVKQKVDYNAIQNFIQVPVKIMEQELRFIGGQAESTKTKMTKQTQEFLKVVASNAELMKRIRVQERLLNKVINNSQRSHSAKASRQHREREYFKKEHQEIFHNRMIETINEILNMLREAFSRDQAICDNLYKSHYLPAGSGLNVKPETH